MTYAAEIGAINRLHFSGVDLLYVCRANLGTDFGANYETFLLQARKLRAHD